MVKGTYNRWAYMLEGIYGERYIHVRRYTYSEKYIQGGGYIWLRVYMVEDGIYIVEGTYNEEYT